MPSGFLPMREDKLDEGPFLRAGPELLVQFVLGLDLEDRGRVPEKAI